MIHHLIEDVELADGEGTYHVFAVKNSIYYYKEQSFFAMDFNTNHFVKYVMDKSFDEIADNHRDEILNYCLSQYTDEDKVQLRDIFLHGKFVTKKLDKISPEFINRTKELFPDLK